MVESKSNEKNRKLPAPLMGRRYERKYKAHREGRRGEMFSGKRVQLRLGDERSIQCKEGKEVARLLIQNTGGHNWKV